MQDEEKKVLETIAEVFPKMDERKKERFIGIAEGMAIMADRQSNGKAQENSPGNTDAV